MSRNGSGIYQPPGASFPAVNNTIIDETKFNNIINDISSALTASIAVDGQSVVTANLPMSGFKHTGVSAANATGQYVEYDQVVSLIAAAQSSAILQAVPAGTIIPFSGTSAPVSYLACPTAAGGAQVALISTYPVLFAAIGTLWGGDGVATFGIPWFPVGHVPVQGGTVGTGTNGAPGISTNTFAYTGGTEQYLEYVYAPTLPAGRYVKYCVKAF